jgi:replicative DNA helicase
MAHNAYDMQTERALLGAMLSAPKDVEQIFLAVPTAAFWSPQARAVAGIIRDMVIKHMPVDPITVLAAVEDLGLLSKIPGPYLIDLHGSFFHVPNADQYADRVTELYGRRRLAEACERELQSLDREWESGEPTPTADAIGRIQATLKELTTYASSASTVEPHTLVDLLSSFEEYDWLVPGLIERGDRLMLTGDEGLGKSEFIAQVSCCTAAGIHPFRGEPILDGNSEMRVSIVDCENSQRQSRRRYRRMVGVVDAQRDVAQLPPVDWGKRMFVEFRTGGMDLLKGTDAAWLERYVGNTAPDILVIGPLYKLTGGANMNDETVAGEVLRVIDGIRERHGCAIITEAHAGQGKNLDGQRYMRPRGSAVLLGWPEFGMGLRRATDPSADPNSADVISWRGQREERDWPQGLVRGHSGMLPWRPNAEYWDRPDSQWDPTTA